MKAKVAEGWWYKVHYQLNGHYEEKWHSVTSLSTEENTRKRKGKHAFNPLGPNIELLRNAFFLN